MESVDLSRLNALFQEYISIFGGVDQQLCENVDKRLVKLLNQLSNRDENDYSSIREQVRIRDRLQEFDYKKSRAWKELEKRNWTERSQKELVSIAQVFAKHCSIDLDRESKRRKEVLIKWFDDHLEELLPKFNNLEIVL